MRAGGILVMPPAGLRRQIGGVAADFGHRGMTIQNEAILARHLEGQLGGHGQRREGKQQG